MTINAKVLLSLPRNMDSDAQVAMALHIMHLEDESLYISSDEDVILMTQTAALFVKNAQELSFFFTK